MCNLEKPFLKLYLLCWKYHNELVELIKDLPGVGTRTEFLELEERNSQPSDFSEDDRLIKDLII